MNLFGTFMTTIGMTVLFSVLGAILGGAVGALVCFGLASTLSLWAWWNADKAVLRLYGARVLSEAEAPALFALVRRLAGRAQLPMPKVYFLEDALPNAFATGRDPDHAAVCVTRGLLARMNDTQLAGVIAHELGHIKHRDTLGTTIVAIVAGAMHRCSRMSLVGVVLAQLLAPIAAALVWLSNSHAREFEADRAGAQITGHPLWLASALDDLAIAASAVSSHPSTGLRIARLRAMAGGPAA